MKIKPQAVLLLCALAFIIKHGYSYYQNHTSENSANNIEISEPQTNNSSNPKSVKSLPLAQNELPISQDFDFYVLSLSWSPTFCMDNSSDSQQCGTNRTFIVHGLWPQYEHGYPRECQSEIKSPSKDAMKQVSNIMPSERLIKLQWNRHGTCSGLKPNDYFAAIKTAYDRVTIPKLAGPKLDGKIQDAGDVENAFINANKGLGSNMIAVTTKDGLLDEVRICLTQQMQFRACPEVDKKAARETYRLKIPQP